MELDTESQNFLNGCHDKEEMELPISDDLFGKEDLMPACDEVPVTDGCKSAKSLEEIPEVERESDLNVNCHTDGSSELNNEAPSCDPHTDNQTDSDAVTNENSSSKDQEKTNMNIISEGQSSPINQPKTITNETPNIPNVTVQSETDNNVSETSAAEDKAKTKNNACSTDNDSITNVSVPSSADDKAKTKNDACGTVTVHKCEMCMYEASDKILFDLHVCKGKVAYEKGQQKEIEITCNGDMFLCGECGYSGQGHGFEEHLMCHLLLRPYQCIYCQESFINRKEIGKHVGIAHPGKKLNCALKAMKKARSFMAETRKSGSYRFFARVSGQVPLGIGYVKTTASPPTQVKLTESKLNESKSEAANSSDEAPSLEKMNDRGLDSVSATETSQKVDSIETEQRSFTKILETVSESITEVNSRSYSDDILPKPAEVNSRIGCDDILPKSAEVNSKDHLPTSTEENSRNSCDENIVPRSPEVPKLDTAPDTDNSPLLNDDTEAVGSAEQAVNGPEEKTVDESSMDIDEHQEENTPVENPVTLETNENTEPNFDSMALKIVAAFSLTDSKSENPENEANDRSDVIPNEAEQSSVRETPQLDPKEVLSAIRKMDKGVNFYACGFLCDFSCLTSAEFKEHLLKEHFGSNTYPCSHCGWTSWSVDGLLKHVTGHAHAYSKTIPLYFCGVSKCRFGTNLLTDFINHVNILHPGLDEHLCKECNSVFDDIGKLLQHFENNFLHVVNCPHCTAKAQNRKVILKHISTAHVGKPKMVSVGKQIICKDRKRNSFHQLKGLISNRRRSSSSTNLEHLLNLEKQLPDFLSNSVNEGLPSSNETSTPKAADTPSEIPLDESSGNMPQLSEDHEDDAAEGFEGEITEGQMQPIVKTEIYEDHPSPASSDESKEQANLKQPDVMTKCNFCTFVARDVARLNGHKTCHGIGGDGRQHAKKQRFKCPYCPQCFENLTKFSAHVACHPGLIKFNLYTCKHCEYNSNQKHVLISHIELKCGRSYSGFIEDLYTVNEKLLESKVLECENCSYQTRHKIHLKVHYESEHKTIISDSSIRGSSSENVQQVSNLRPEEVPPIKETSSSSSRENISKKFMCPVCFYLLPKGADLKKHIRKHPELGKVSLVLYRCRYCSCASTAKHVIVGHLRTKHQGRELALVKKVISIDTRDTDNSFSETQVSETPMTLSALEVQELLMKYDMMNDSTSSKPADGDEEENSDPYHYIFIVPEYSQGNFATRIKCPCCQFSTEAASSLIQHLKVEHPTLCVVGKQMKPVVRYYKLGSEVPYGLLSLLQASFGLKQEVVILSYKDVFSVSAKCPKCEFSTFFKQNLALHMRDHHRELSILEAQKEEIKQLPKKASPKTDSSVTKLIRKQEPIIVGSGILDDKLKGLYENLGFIIRCSICGTERPKRYHMHVHILRHLNVALWKCQYCDYKGLERYKMCKHIKDQHPQKKIAIRYLPLDIEEKIAVYLNQRLSDKANTEEGGPSKLSPTAKYSMDAAFSPLGNDDIDEHLKELYREEGELYCCILCSFTVRRKFAVHRHIVSSHLAIALVGCGYCGFRGIDRKSIVDHSHEYHPQSTLNIILLTNNLKKAVSDCLSSSGLNQDSAPSPVSENLPVKSPEPQKVNQKARKSFPVPKLPPITSPTHNPSPQETPPAMKKYVMGTEGLDLKLRILYSNNHGKFKCTICENDFPRRYAIHRHILMCHLKVGLMQCPLCTFSGVERYIVVNHLKEHHKVDDQIPYPCAVDIDDKISNFLSQKLSGTNKDHLKAKKRLKTRSPKQEVTSPGAGDTPEPKSSPLVVALFNKRKSLPEEHATDDLEVKKIKKEVIEDENGGKENVGEEKEVGELGKNQDDDEAGEELENSNLDDDEDDESKNDSQSADNVSEFKARAMLDVATDIKVVNLSYGYTKRFGCGKCSFQSVHRANILRHIFRVHENYRYKICRICGYKTLSKLLMQKHIEEKHEKGADNNIMYEELNADKMRLRKADLAKSNLEEEPAKKGSYACAYCSYEANTSENMIKHIEKSHSNNSTSSERSNPQTPVKKTQTSMKSFVKPPLLRVPNFFAKPDVFKKKNYKCEFCDFQCRIYRLLKSHVALVHKNQPSEENSPARKPNWKFACIECHLKIEVGTKMKYHLNRHIGYKPFVCETCTADFASPDEMRKHIRRYKHSEKINYVKEDKAEEKLDSLLTKCKDYANDIHSGKVPNKTPDRIGQRIIKKRNFVIDANVEEESPPKKPKQEASPEKSREKTNTFGCTSCSYSAESIHDVSVHHTRSHKKKEFLWKDYVMGYTCDSNGVIVESERELPKTKPLLFTTSGDDTHVYTCIKCGFISTVLQGMIGHVKAHGTRDYLCAYCSNRYFKKIMLARHQKAVHKGKRLWIIHQCQDESGIKTEPEVHSESTSVENASTSSISYCCHLCSFTSDSLYQYRLHLPTHGQCERLVPDISSDPTVNVDEAHGHLQMLANLDPRVEIESCSALMTVNDKPVLQVDESVENVVSSTTALSDAVGVKSDPGDGFENESKLDSSGCGEPNTETAGIASQLNSLASVSCNGNLGTPIESGENHKEQSLSLPLLMEVDKECEDVEGLNSYCSDSTNKDVLMNGNEALSELLPSKNSSQCERKKNLFETFSAENPSFT